MGRRKIRRAETIVKEKTSQSVEVAAIKLNTDPYVEMKTVYESAFKPTGDLGSFSLQTILQNPQSNIESVYKLMAYYVASDPIYSSAIKNVLVPFSVTNWRLQGSNEKSKTFFYQYFEQIGLNDLLYGIYYDLYLYGNVYIYRHENGYLQILPPHRVFIQDISMDGEPIVYFKVPDRSNSGGSISEKFMKTMEEKYKAWPPEILEGIRKGQSKIQLDPARTYCIQNTKSTWEKYAMPLGISLLPLFNKKNLISDAENADLNNVKKSILHVKVGNKDTRAKPDKDQLTQVGQSFIDALSGKNLAITAWDVEAAWKYVDNKEFSNSIKQKYSEVNAQILSGLGLASIIVTGDSVGSSFASAQVNTAIASKRIMQNIRNVAQFLKKVMGAVSFEQRINANRIPDIIFDKVDLSSNEAAMEEIMSLYDKGMVGRRTVFERLGMDFDQERQRKEQEISDSDDEIFVLPPNPNTTAGESQAGAPVKDVKNSKTDKNNSESGKNPKPSTE